MRTLSLDIDSSELSAYEPSQIKIVIGVTGKIDSLVSAFLLQKQGFQCIAVGIMNWVEPKYHFNLSETCSVNHLEKVKAMCEKINIPFYAVDAQKEYKELVVNQLVADRVAGLANWPCLECHKMKMTLLYEKMKKLGAHYIATGHYAKCYKNHTTQTFAIHSATDKNHDQSPLLGGLSQDILRKLILPLAELQKPEVLKLSKKFHFGDEKAEHKEEEKELQCFGTVKELFEYIENNVPPDFREPGSVLDVYTRVPLAEHQGLFRHTIAEVAAEDLKNEKEVKVPVEINSLENTIYKGYIKDFECDFFQLVDVDLPKDVDRSQPMTVFCKFGHSNDLIAGELSFKNNFSLVLQLSKKLPIMAEHEVVTLYNKDSGVAKLLGRGKLLFRGTFTPVDRGMHVAEVLRDENGVVIKEEPTLSQIGFKF